MLVCLLVQFPSFYKDAGHIELGPKPNGFILTPLPHSEVRGVRMSTYELLEDTSQLIVCHLHEGRELVYCHLQGNRQA